MAKNSGFLTSQFYVLTSGCVSAACQCGRISMRYLMSACVAALGCVLLQPVSAQEERGVPILSAPYHLPVFRNEYVTLLNIYVPPGKTTGYHTHTSDSVSVNIESADMTNQPLGAPAAGPPQRGEA